MIDNNYNKAKIIQTAYKRLDICSICLKYVIKNNKYCHSFHEECITRWFILNNIHCPNCRNNIIDITNDNKINNLLSNISINLVHKILMISKNKLKKIKVYKKQIINKHIHSIIKFEAYMNNMSSTEYILYNELNLNYDTTQNLSKEIKESKIIEYLKNRLTKFTRGPNINNIKPVKYLLLENYIEYRLIIYHIKLCIKNCKILLCSFNNYYLNDYLKIENAINYIKEELPTFLNTLN